MVLSGGLSLPHMVWVFNESLEGGSSNCLKAQSHSYLAIDWAFCWGTQPDTYTWPIQVTRASSRHEPWAPGQVI